MIGCLGPARLLLIALTGLAVSACASGRAELQKYDVIIRGGVVYDGEGGDGRVADIAVEGDRIAGVGDFAQARGKVEIDASGKAVAPGFINMLSWTAQSIRKDGRALGDIVQGVTLEVLGEGWSLGPVPEDENAVLEAIGFQEDQDVAWRTLGEALDHIVEGGVSPNIASFVGATTIRIHELGFDNREASPEELAAMEQQVRTAMEDGAMGLSTSLIYPPAFYAPTSELVALAGAAGEYGGMYISHMRSEGAAIEAAVDELVAIAREANVPAEIYHLKFAGQDNWDKYEMVIGQIEAARAEGLRITADIYTYTAAATGLTATIPPWASEGGLDALIERLKNPAMRSRIIAEMKTPSDEWENLLLASGGADGVLLNGFRSDALKSLQGRRLSDVARERGTDAEETIADLIVEDGSRVGAIYFVMSEDNLRRKIALPWVSFGSDGEASAPEGEVLERPTHPRAYGTFARVLGKYARDEKLFSLGEAVRKLSALPADNLGLKDRGRIRPGYFADIVVFDPKIVADRATFAKPHQLSVGMEQVFVNGVHVLKDGVHTGATPGRVVRGPGYRPQLHDVVSE